MKLMTTPRRRSLTTSTVASSSSACEVQQVELGGVSPTVNTNSLLGLELYRRLVRRAVLAMTGASVATGE
jgi:hypothetical protein